jgi:hypothetical protein
LTDDSGGGAATPQTGATEAPTVNNATLCHASVDIPVVSDLRIEVNVDHDTVIAVVAAAEVVVEVKVKVKRGLEPGTS